jgi:hypothetical protein
MAKFLNKCSAHAANVRPATGPATVTRLLRRNSCAQLGPEWVKSAIDGLSAIGLKQLAEAIGRGFH